MKGWLSFVTGALVGLGLAAGAPAAAPELLDGPPRAAQRPWTVLANSLTTLDMRLYAVRVGAAPTIDGRLDEPVWREAFSVSAFGREAFRGYSPRANSVRLLYDDQALYVGCTGAIDGWHDWLAPLRPRDGGAWRDDAFEVFVDPGLTRKDYWQFIVNAVGSIEDHRGWDAKPNPDWRVAVSHSETSWTAEMAIPFASLGAAPPKKGDVWGLNVFRDDKELKASFAVSPVLDSAHDTSRFLPLEFGDVPDVFLDAFDYDKVIRGENVLRFKAFGRGVEGARVKGTVTAMDGPAVGGPREIPLAAKGPTEFPFTITSPGQSRLAMEIARGGKVLGRYVFLVNLYEERLIIPVLGGVDFYEGRPRAPLRLDVRLKEELLPSFRVELALLQGDKVLKQGRIDRIPGVFTRCDIDLAGLAVGAYAVEARLIGADEKVAAASAAPLHVIEGPFGAPEAKAGPPTSAVAAAPEPVPEQFAVWGTLGKEIEYRRCTAQQVDEMKKAGKTDAEIDRANQTYDCRAWPEVQDMNEKPPTVFTDQERRDGYVLFTRPYVDPVYTYTVPEAAERTSDLAVFAAQGQYEPITFSVHALKDLKEVGAEVSSLAGPGEEVLGRANFDVRIVRCYEKAWGSPWWNPDQQDKKTGLPQKEVIPLVLEKRPSIAVPAGQSRQFWVTLEVPEKCRAGVYSGRVTLSVDGARREIPLRVRVLPFRLVALDKVTFMDNAPTERDALIDYREHGFNTIQLGLTLPPQAQAAVEAAFREFDKTGKAGVKVPLPPVEEVMAFNRPRLDRAIGLAREAHLPVRRVYFSLFSWFICGWNGDWFKYFPPTPELEDAYTGVVNATVAYAKEKGFPEFVLFCGDEPGGHPQTLPDIRHWLEVAKRRCPGVKTGMPVGGGLSMGLDELGQLGPHLDIVDTNYLNPEVLKQVRRGQKELWICNAGSGATATPRLDRYGFGFFAWKIGARGMAQWVWRAGNVYEQAYGLGTAYVFPSVDGKPLPTIHWEAMRQAFIDQRYGATLTRLVEAARSRGDAKARQAALEAGATIKDVLGQFHLDYMDRRFPAGASREFHIHSTDGGTFQACRWRVAREILRLQAVLGQAAALDPEEKVFPLAPEETVLD